MENRLSNNEIKEELFLILNAFSNFCDQNNLKYYLFGGTLLGAIRHQDFIPWDDDIDVAMSRPDYEKMISLLKNRLIDEKYELRCSELKNLEFPFAKLVNINIYGTAKYSVDDTRLWIDIFPIDGLPSDKRKCEKHIKRMRWNQFLFNWSRSKVFVGKSLGKVIVRLPFLVYAHIRGSSYFRNKMIKLAKTYSFEESDFVGNIIWAVGTRERLEKEVFFQDTKVVFHGSKFNASKNWDYYLKKIYGDYMKLPPENERVNHSITMYRRDI